ncbi:MAG: antibiotic biosynthesis monooxygenase family protein [Thermoleophilia bacterium]
MSAIVIVDLPADSGKKGELEGMLREALRDTRSFAGCRGASLCVDGADDAMVTIVERWETLEHYLKYDAWRVETGFMDKIGPLLGGDPGERHLEEIDA